MKTIDDLKLEFDMFSIAILIFTLAVIPFPALAQDAASEKRIALVVGNGAYRDERDRLDNPVNDAEAVGKRLEALGFEVILALDLGRDDMGASLEAFSRKLTDASAALFFYAGHGMQYRGENYLFPTDASLESEFNIDFSLINANTVLDLMKDAGVGTRLVFLDACRNNPMENRFRSPSGSSRSPQISRGLAPAKGATATGTFIAYATATGDVADDGRGDHSPFTEALLKHLDRPKLSVVTLMQEVTKSVGEATEGSQVPWISSSLTASFIINRGTETLGAETQGPIGLTLDDMDFTSRMTLSDKRRAQRALKELGFYRGDIRNDFRSDTHNAIKSWQRNLGLKSTGFLTENEHRRLVDAIEDQPIEPRSEGQTVTLSTPSLPPPFAEPRPPAELTRQQWREMQFALSRLGHYDAAIDGIFGDKSEAAIKTWQRTEDMAETGYLAEWQIAYLYLLSLPELDGFRKRSRQKPQRKTAERFRDCEDCPEMVMIPGGRFEMGARSRFTREQPPHDVDVTAFALGRFEITFADWKACVRDRACDNEPLSASPSSDRRPIVNVTWRDARDYAAWLSGRTNLTYRLPSEAEWEYAVRAGSKDAFASGDQITAKDANFDDSRSSPDRRDQFRGRPIPVGSFRPNRFGLYDMQGNVREWVEDRWHDDYISAPVDGSAWIDARSIERVLRGGSWADDESWLRSAARHKAEPNARDAYTGFRVARDLAP